MIQIKRGLEKLLAEWPSQGVRITIYSNMQEAIEIYFWVFSFASPYLMSKVYEPSPLSGVLLPPSPASVS